MTHSKAAANRAGIAHQTKAGSAVKACCEDDASSTSASSMHGDGGSDIHAISSDEEHDTAMNQSEVMQHRNMLANAPWRREEQQQRQKQKQKQKQCVVNLCKVGQPCAPPGLPLPATAVGGKAAFAALQAPAFRPPPGLPPPDLRPPPGFVELPPGLPLPEVRPITGAENHNSEGAPVIFEYTAQAFRRELAKIMRELRLHKKSGLSVGQVRICGVPQERQAAEFADILTRSVEESRGPVRRTCMAFVGGLTKAFEKLECIAGLRTFFDEVYPDLCTEVPRLRIIVMTELMPTLKAVLEHREWSALQPSLFDAVGCYAA